jgi:signal transduction histidine kinase
LFFDTSSGFLAEPHDSEDRSSRAPRGHVVRTGSYNVLGDPFEQGARERRRQPSRHSFLRAASSRNTSITVPNAELLGFSIENLSSLQGNQPDSIESFPFLEEDFLLQLTKTYPNGTIWLFREDGSLSTSTDNVDASRPFPRRSGEPKKADSYERRKAEAATLRIALPKARQIVFAPLFEAELARATAGCFAYTEEAVRILSAENELGFIKSFVNSVGAQVGRINAIAADKSKNAFIGSISHELRSPLHGILAAAEFLEDTNLDTYQKSLINTQVSCGKTLLQVIEHVLDYSKINSFEKVFSIFFTTISPLMNNRTSKRL